jgi:hypothetical protein
VSFEFNLDFFCFFEVVYNDTSALVGANSDRMTIRTERDRAERSFSLNFFDLLSLHDVEELDPGVQAG